MAMFKVEFEVSYPGDAIELKKTIGEALRHKYIHYDNIKVSEIDLLNEYTQLKNKMR